MKSNFEKGTVYLGEVPERKTIRVEFNVISDRNINKVEPACGCTPSTFSQKAVYFKYRTGSLPLHLRAKGRSLIDKSIMVFFSDGTKEEIYVKAILVNKI